MTSAFLVFTSGFNLGRLLVDFCFRTLLISSSFLIEYLRSWTRKLFIMVCMCLLKILQESLQLFLKNNIYFVDVEREIFESDQFSTDTVLKISFSFIFMSYLKVYT